MKIFGRNDELFELMAQATAKHAARPGGPTQPTTPRPRSVSSHFGRTTPMGPMPEPESEFYEINGEALIVVEDDWEQEDPGQTQVPAYDVTPATTGTHTEGTKSTLIARSETLTRVFARTLSMRKDTLAVGGALMTGVAIAMFLLGRSTASAPTNPGTPQVAVIQADAEDPTPSPIPSETGPFSTPESEADLLPPESAPPAVARNHGSTSLAASSPRAPQRRVANGKFDLLVCYTTKDKAEQLATWLNEDPASPLARDLSLEATAKRGSVRIKGFPARDEAMLKRIHETRDPTGGSGTFSDAQWRNAN